MDVKINVTSDKKRMRPKKSEILILKSNNLKARKLLKWKPEFIKKKGFIKALKQTIDWYSKSENIKNFKEDIYNI